MIMLQGDVNQWRVKEVRKEDGWKGGKETKEETRRKQGGKRKEEEGRKEQGGKGG